jgi:tetratricopeptide (TPR) repeat protein
VIETYESDDVYSEWGGQFSEAFFLTLCAGEYVTLGHSGANPYAIRAVARALQGKTREALIDFKRAEDFRQRELEKFRARRHSHEALVRHKQSGEPLPDDWDKPSRQPTPLTGYAAMYCAMLLTRLGKLNTALKILRYVRRRSMYFLHKWPRMAACADVATSDVYRLMGQHEDARHALEYPLTWARETGQQEIVCWARLSEARLELAQNRLDEAQRALDEASTVAQGCEFKLYEADCMVTAGRIALIRGDVETAATMSSQALHMAGDPDCAYAWAQGNALHLLGEVVLRGGDRERVGRLLQGAARLRARLEDPRLANTQEILAQMPDATQGE